MRRIVYQGVQFGVADITIDGEGGKLLQFVDEKHGEYIEFPMSNDDAKHVARLLSGSGVVIPSAKDKETFGP